MTTENLALQIDRARHGESRVWTTALPALASGQVRFRVDRVAITANTVTYATLGDALGYWDFFPTGTPGWGHVPAMGWADLVASNHPDVPAGGRYYGWFPMARHVDVTVTATPDGVRDDGPHRAAHARVYRVFSATGRDPLYQAGEDAEDRHALLRGLFVSGWLAEDFFADNAWFGARRVVVLSASSKTAIAFARCAAARGGVEVVGVTSPANAAFVAALGCYHRVVTYDAIATLPVDADVVSIDMAGSAAVLAAVHSHFAGRLRHSMSIGRSHHAAPPAREGFTGGPTPVFFFAPMQVKKRVTDWGPRDYQQRVTAAVHAFVGWSREWLAVHRSTGAAAVAATWRAVHAGHVAPGIGHVTSMWN